MTYTILFYLELYENVYLLYASFTISITDYNYYVNLLLLLIKQSYWYLNTYQSPSYENNTPSPSIVLINTSVHSVSEIILRTLLFVSTNINGVNSLFYIIFISSILYVSSIVI